jgi:hypothetical protein
MHWPRILLAITFIGCVEAFIAILVAGKHRTRASPLGHAGGHRLAILLNGEASFSATPGTRLSVVRNFGHGASIINLRNTHVALGPGKANKILIKRFLGGEDGCQS